MHKIFSISMVIITMFLFSCGKENVPCVQATFLEERNGQWLRKQFDDLEHWLYFSNFQEARNYAKENNLRIEDIEEGIRYSTDQINGGEGFYRNGLGMKYHRETGLLKDSFYIKGFRAPQTDSRFSDEWNYIEHRCYEYSFYESGILKSAKINFILPELQKFYELGMGTYVWTKEETTYDNNGKIESFVRNDTIKNISGSIYKELSNPDGHVGVLLLTYPLADDSYSEGLPTRKIRYSSKILVDEKNPLDANYQPLKRYDIDYDYDGKFKQGEVYSLENRGKLRWMKNETDTIF